MINGLQEAACIGYMPNQVSPIQTCQVSDIFITLQYFSCEHLRLKLFFFRIVILWFIG